MAWAAKRLRKGRVSDQVREHLTKLMVQGKLKIGDQLPPVGELAKQFGVSRVPVREGLISMEMSGLLTIKRGAGGGVFVAQPNAHPVSEALTLMLRLGKASIRELTEARLLIEPEVARLAALRSTAKDRRVLQETIDTYLASVEKGEPRSIRDMDFHMRLAEASHNAVYILIMQSLGPLLYNSVRQHKLTQQDRRRGIQDHQDILDAISAGRADEVSSLMAAHVSNMATFWK